MIYLDNAATTMVSQEVIDAMSDVGLYAYANPNSVHAEGRAVRKLIDEARNKIAATINASPEQIIFTSGATEADNMAIRSGVLSLDPVRDPHRLCALISSVEHKAVLEYAKFMRSDYPAIYTHGVDSTEILFMLNTRGSIGFLSTMYINNETGYIFEIPKIGRKCHKLGIKFHTDCAQAYGKVDIDVKRDNIDFMSVSGHKIYGPKGVGFLYARDPEIVKPVIYGGGQEFGKRSGTENTMGIVGLGVAAEMACYNIKGKSKYLNELRTQFITEVKSRVDGFHVNGVPFEGSGIVSFRFDGVDGQTLASYLSAHGIMVSAGSACNSGDSEPSHVLTAIGLSPEEAMSSIRVSFGERNTIGEIVTAAKAIAEGVEFLRKEK